jgi:hypothetical protein
MAKFLYQFKLGLQSRRPFAQNEQERVPEPVSRTSLVFWG